MESMEFWSAHGASGEPSALAGLVLLYAPNFERYAPAYVLSQEDLLIGRDPAMGILRHADAGYEEAIQVAREHGVQIPGLTR